MKRPRFDALLTRGLEAWKERPVEPVLLRSLVAQLRENAAKVGQVADNPRFYEIALQRLLEQGADSLRSRDDIVLAARLSVPHTALNDVSLVENKQHLGPVLRRWRERIGSSIFGATLWHSVFVSYFLVGDKEIRQWVGRFLSDTLPALDTGPTSPGWVAIVHEHDQVLGPAPAKIYADRWIAGDETAINSLRVHAKIPESSWLWQEFVVAILQAVAALDDEEFVHQVPRVVGLSSRFEHASDSILAQLLERHVASDTLRPDETFLQRLVDAWGSPQLDFADKSHRWTQVSDKAVKLVCRWLAEDDLSDFFELIKSTRALEDMDERRFAYWMRFTGRMSYTKLVLGPTYRYSRNQDVQKFVNKRKSRLSWLTSSTADNIAIVMKFDGWWFVEFAQTGNACYGYSDTKRPFDINRNKISIAQLKNKVAAGRHWLTHQGDWEVNFDRELAGLKIWPNSIKSRPKSYRSGMTSTSDVEPLRQDKQVAADLGILGQLSIRSRDELGRITKGVVDSRNKGGRYWVELHSTPSKSLRAEMSGLGFRYAEHRGFYR